MSLANISNEIKNEKEKEKEKTIKISGFQFKKTFPIKNTKIVANTKNRINNVSNSMFGDNDDDHPEEIDFVTCIDDKTIKGSKKVTSIKNDEDYVIPLILVNKYKIDETKIDNLSIKEEDDQYDKSDNAVDVKSEETLLEKAKRELINQSKIIEQDSESKRSLAAWQSLLINKLPDEYENDSKCDVSMRPTEPKLEDYQKIPVIHYGTAMLRGMGWKEGDAIGGINKSVTPIIEPQLRPRGLGLGADITLKKQLEENSHRKNSTKTMMTKDEILRKGCHVCVELGPHKNRYGIVDNIDDDLIYARVKLTISKEYITIPQDLLRVVTKKEFDIESKVINKNKYEQYKQQQQPRRKV